MSEDRKIVLEEKRNVSSKISETTRYIGYGLVAVVYAVLTSESKKVNALFDAHTVLLVVSAFAGAAAVLFDYLQFVCGYLSVRQALKALDSKYDDEYWPYKFRSHFFWLKQIFAFMGALLFTVLLLWSVLGGQAWTFERLQMAPMTTVQVFTLAGLTLDLTGAILLYFFTTPKKQVGNAVLDGENMYVLADPALRHVDEEEWSPIFNRVIDRSRKLTKLGFGMLVFGALLQIVGNLLQRS